MLWNGIKKWKKSTNNMGWKPKISDNLMIIDEPRREESLMIRCFDPDRYFLGKLKADTSGKSNNIYHWQKIILPRNVLKSCICKVF
jgi:hypothetical protein